MTLCYLFMGFMLGLLAVRKLRPELDPPAALCLMIAFTFLWPLVIVILAADVVVEWIHEDLL